MTPLQMALIGATIANGGDEPRPYVVRQVVRDGRAGSVVGDGNACKPGIRRDGRERDQDDGRRRAARHRHSGARCRT